MTGGEKGVRNGTEFLYAKGQARGVKQKKSRKESDKAILASVMKEMAEPRFAESSRKEEEAAHGVRGYDSSKNTE